MVRLGEMEKQCGGHIPTEGRYPEPASLVHKFEVPWFFLSLLRHIFLSSGHVEELSLG